MQRGQETDGEEARVIAKQIPAAHGPTKTFPVKSPIVLAHYACRRSRNQESFNLGVKPAQQVRAAQVAAIAPSKPGRSDLGWFVWGRAPSRHNGLIKIA